MPKNPEIKKVLVIGSGPIVIGQAAEFDYAGTQACRSLKEEGIEVVLLNSNPATIMTDKDIADRVYIEPLTTEVVEQLIKKEKPDSVLPTLGGQAGLNLAMELEEAGIDGLVVMPVDCDNVRVKLNALTEERNIPVVTFNSDIVGTKRCCFVGLDNWKSGRTAAGLMGMMMRGKGKVLVITGYFSNSAGSRRVDGFVEELKRSFPEMDLVGVQSSFDHTDEVEKIIVNAMSAFPDLEGIFVASGGQAGVRKAFDKLKLEKRPYVIIYDLTPKNEKALLEDTVDFLIDQEGYDQGYRALSILSDLLRRGRMPEKEYMYTEINIKTKYNLN